MPVMFMVTIVAARWIVRRFAVSLASSDRLGMGATWLGILLAFEFTLVLWLQGLSFRGYVATRDPVSGSVYYSIRAVFGIMPALAGRN